MSEPSAMVACPHWADGKVTMRKVCTACAAEGRAAEQQSEPTDAQLDAAADAIAKARGYVHGACMAEHYRDALAALRAAEAAR